MLKGTRAQPRLLAQRAHQVALGTAVVRERRVFTLQIMRLRTHRSGRAR
jgi:hypothetical protein